MDRLGERLIGVDADGPELGFGRRARAGTGALVPLLLGSGYRGGACARLGLPQRPVTAPSCCYGGGGVVPTMADDG